MRLKPTIIACAALAAMWLGPVPAQASTFVNGGFESILAGWTTNAGLVQTPGVFEHRTAGGVSDKSYDPVEGWRLAVIQAGQGGVPVTLSQTFTTSGGIFSGSAAFLGEDEAGFNDSGFVRIVGAADFLFYADINGVGGYGYTKWTEFSTVLAAGTYTIEAGAVNFDDTLNPSFLLVDNFVMAEVPEPATWALMLAGFLGLGAALRRRRAALA